MLSAYLQYWGLKEPPFSLAPSPRMFYLSDQHRECLMRLKYAIHSGKGGALLVSEHAGDGKTTTLQLLMQQLVEETNDRIRIAFLDYPTMTPAQMVAEIARQLGVDGVSGDKVRDINLLREHLRACHGRGIRNLVVVDEGQMMAEQPELLQEFRILLNFCVGGEFLLSFILSGQAPLDAAVRAFPEFWQRLPVRYMLRNLGAADTRNLVHHRLAIAGAARPLFTDTALEGVFRFSQGCPRVICAVADLALVVGHSNRSRYVDFAEVTQACSDMEHSSSSIHYYDFLNAPADANAWPAPAAPGSARRGDTSGRTMPHWAAGPGAAPALRTDPAAYTMAPTLPQVAFSLATDTEQPVRPRGAPRVLPTDPIPPDWRPAASAEGAAPLPEEMQPGAAASAQWQPLESAAGESTGVSANSSANAPASTPGNAGGDGGDSGDDSGNPSRPGAGNGPAVAVEMPPLPVVDPEAVARLNREPVHCPMCATAVAHSAEACPKCQTVIKVACGRCRSLQSVLRSRCGYCSFPINAWARESEKEFLAGLRRLDLLQSAESAERVKFQMHPTMEGRVLYFAPRDTLFRQGARVGVIQEGQPTEFAGCAVMIGNRRLVFLYPDRRVDLELEELDACDLVSENGAQGGGLVIRAGNLAWQVHLPIREGRRTAAYRLVQTFLARMRTAVR
ncbi:MAG: AAA family ATPase [Nitrospirota bacterium]|nr:AAA family ATPase [Nitrospirota bacterium]